MWDANVNEEERAHLDALGARLGDIRRAVEENAAAPVPGQRAEDLEERVDEAWRLAGERAEIPEDARPVLTGMLRDGTTIRAVAEKFTLTKYTARTWLEKLRGEGLVYVDGERKAARWRLAPPPGEGDAQ
jgi:DNA-binding transcriptional ArsR family regulator